VRALAPELCRPPPSEVEMKAVRDCMHCLSSCVYTFYLLLVTLNINQNYYSHESGWLQLTKDRQAEQECLPATVIKLGRVQRLTLTAPPKFFGPSSYKTSRPW